MSPAGNALAAEFNPIQEEADSSSQLSVANRPALQLTGGAKSPSKKKSTKIEEDEENMRAAGISHVIKLGPPTIDVDRVSASRRSGGGDSASSIQTSIDTDGSAINKHFKVDSDETTSSFRSESLQSSSDEHKSPKNPFADFDDLARKYGRASKQRRVNSKQKSNNQLRNQVNLLLGLSKGLSRQPTSAIKETGRTPGKRHSGSCGSSAADQRLAVPSAVNRMTKSMTKRFKQSILVAGNASSPGAPQLPKTFMKRFQSATANSSPNANSSASPNRNPLSSHTFKSTFKGSPKRQPAFSEVKQAQIQLRMMQRKKTPKLAKMATRRHSTTEASSPFRRIGTIKAKPGKRRSHHQMRPKKTRDCSLESELALSQSSLRESAKEEPTILKMTSQQRSNS